MNENKNIDEAFEKAFKNQIEEDRSFDISAMKKSDYLKIVSRERNPFLYILFSLLMVLIIFTIYNITAIANERVSSDVMRYEYYNERLPGENLFSRSDEFYSKYSSLPHMLMFFTVEAIVIYFMLMFAWHVLSYLVNPIFKLMKRKTIVV